MMTATPPSTVYRDAVVELRGLGYAELDARIDAFRRMVADPFDEVDAYQTEERLRAALEEREHRDRLHAAGADVPDPNAPDYLVWRGLARDIVEHADLLYLFERFGVDLHKAGQHEYCGACPFCGGTDRFRVWPTVPGKVGRYWCRQCEASGDAIDLYRTMQGLDFFEAVREGATALGLPVPAPRQVSGAMSPGRLAHDDCPTCKQLQAENERLKGHNAILRQHVRRRLHLYMEAQRRQQVVTKLSTVPLYRGHTPVVMEIVRQMSAAPEEDRRPDGSVRFRRWLAAKESGASKDVVSDAVKNCERAGLIVCDRPKKQVTDDDGKRTLETEIYVRLPDHVTIPESKNRELALLDYFARQAPTTKRTGKRGFTHGGSRPVCNRCGPDTEIVHTVRHTWKCTGCNTVLESREEPEKRYRNDGRPIVSIVPAPERQIATQEESKDIGRQFASRATAYPTTEREVVDTLDALQQEALRLRGRHVTTPDGAGVVQEVHIERQEARVLVDGRDTWHRLGRVTLVPTLITEPAPKPPPLSDTLPCIRCGEPATHERADGPHCFSCAANAPGSIGRPLVRGASNAAD
jgi:rubrerythrin